jgi:hypothetical protein
MSQYVMYDSVVGVTVGLGVAGVGEADSLALGDGVGWLFSVTLISAGPPVQVRRIATGQPPINVMPSNGWRGGAQAVNVVTAAMRTTPS